MDGHNWHHWSDDQDPDTGDLHHDSGDNYSDGHHPADPYGDPYGHDGPLGHHHDSDLGHPDHDHYDQPSYEHSDHEHSGYGHSNYDSSPDHDLIGDAHDPLGEPVDLGHHHDPVDFPEPAHHLDLNPVDAPHIDDGRHVEQFVVGTDPDTTPVDDGAWHESLFPPHLHLANPPEPVDGFPWSDPATLGHHGTHPAGHDPATVGPAATGNWPSPPANELANSAGTQVPEGPSGWQRLMESEDPAVSSLAKWWAPGQR